MAQMFLDYQIDRAPLSSPGAPKILTLLRPSWTPWASVLQAATEQPTRRRWFLALCTNLKKADEKSEPGSLALAGAHPAVVQATAQTRSAGFQTAEVRACGSQALASLTASFLLGVSSPLTCPTVRMLAY